MCIRERVAAVSSPGKADTNSEIRGLPDEFKQSGGDGGPLGGKGSNEEIETNTPVAMTTKKGHQKSKSDKYHDMDVLKH